jgi:hypothetical protein
MILGLAGGEGRMTASEWATSTHALAMLDALDGSPHAAPLRRFACACCRRLWELLPAESRQALELAERYADGQASDAELAAAHEEAARGYRRADRQISFKKRKVRTQARAALAVLAAVSPDPWRAAREAAAAIVDLFGEQPAELLRGLLPEPFAQDAVAAGARGGIDSTAPPAGRRE